MGLELTLKHRRVLSNTAPKEMHGFEVPKTTVEAIELDKKNGNTRWIDAIRKEVEMILKYQVFEIKKRGEPGILFPKSEG